MYNSSVDGCNMYVVPTFATVTSAAVLTFTVNVVHNVFPETKILLRNVVIRSRLRHRTSPVQLKSFTFWPCAGVAFPLTDTLQEKTLRRSSSEKETRTDFPISADIEEAGAPVSTGLNNSCDCGPATGSSDGLLHHGTSWYLAPGESRRMIDLLTKMLKDDNH
ncbi:hypothetical protein STEG23_032980 [Scotinomys teguina]